MMAPMANQVAAMAPMPTATVVIAMMIPLAVIARTMVVAVLMITVSMIPVLAAISMIPALVITIPMITVRLSAVVLVHVARAGLTAVVRLGNGGGSAANKRKGERPDEDLFHEILRGANGTGPHHRLSDLSGS